MTGKAEKPSHEDKQEEKKAVAKKAEPMKADKPEVKPSTMKAAPEKAEPKAVPEKAEPNTPKGTGKPEKKIEKLRCSTCGISVESDRVWVDFKCPACGKETITRCERCKRLENTYTCKGCGFVGP